MIPYNEYFADGAFISVIIAEILEETGDLISWESTISVEVGLAETFLELLHGDAALFGFGL